MVRKKLCRAGFAARGRLWFSAEPVQVQSPVISATSSASDLQSTAPRPFLTFCALSLRFPILPTALQPLKTYRLFESSVSVGEIRLEPYRFRKLNDGILQLTQPRQGDSQVETCIHIVRP